MMTLALVLSQFLANFFYTFSCMFFWCMLSVMDTLQNENVVEVAFWFFFLLYDLACCLDDKNTHRFFSFCLF